LSTDVITSITATIGGGFAGGVLLGYALKKVVKLLAVMAGLFIAGLAYLQYQQIASFNWNKIEGTITLLANTTANTFNDYSIETLGLTYFGIPLTIGMSAGFAIGFMRDNKSCMRTMFLQGILEQFKVLLMRE
jgi:uncharacterized membrane protein (Fun14 family)